MTTEPTFPIDATPGRVAPVTPPAPTTPPAPPANDAAPSPATTGDAIKAALEREAVAGVTWQTVGVGAAIGIGSAAIAAALLYRARKS